MFRRCSDESIKVLSSRASATMDAISVMGEGGPEYVIFLTLSTTREHSVNSPIQR
jgi:hypothetical protein